MIRKGEGESGIRFGWKRERERADAGDALRRD